MSYNRKLINFLVFQDKWQIPSGQDRNPTPDFRIAEHKSKHSRLSKTEFPSTLAMDSHGLERKILAICTISYGGMTRNIRASSVALYEDIIEPQIITIRSAISVPYPWSAVKVREMIWSRGSLGFYPRLRLERLCTSLQNCWHVSSRIMRMPREVRFWKEYPSLMALKSGYETPRSSTVIVRMGILW